MKIGIIGAGQVGISLGNGWLAAGHEITWSSRTPDSEAMRQLADTTAGSVATVAETVAFGDVLALAVAEDTVADVLTQSDEWRHKIVVDATNVLNRQLVESPTVGLAEATGARVVKAFNTIGAEHYTDPLFSGHAASMFLCGNDLEARAVVSQLAADLGFDPIDIGGLDKALILDHLAHLWIGLMVSGRGRDFAITVVDKEPTGTG